METLAGPLDENILKLLNVEIEDSVLIELGIYGKYRFIMDSDYFDFNGNIYNAGAMGAFIDTIEYIPDYTEIVVPKLQCTNCHIEEFTNIAKNIEREYHKSLKAGGTVEYEPNDWPMLNASAYSAIKTIYPNAKFIGDLNDQNLYNTLLINEFAKLGYSTDATSGVSGEIIKLLGGNGNPKWFQKFLGNKISKNLNFLLSGYNTPTTTANDFINGAFSLDPYTTLTCSKLTKGKIIEFIQYLRTITDKDGPILLPPNICKMSFILFVTIIKFYKFKELAFDGTLIIKPINVDVVAKPPNFCTKMKSLATYMSSTLSFNDVKEIFILSDFDEDDIPYLVYHSYETTNLFCLFVCSGVLHVKFKQSLGVALRAFWQFLSEFLTPTINTTCCGNITLAGKSCSKICEITPLLPPDEKIRQSLEKVLSNARTQTDFINLVNTVNVNKYSLLPLFTFSSNQLDYFIGNLINKYETSSEYSVRLQNYLKNNKFSPYAQSYPLNDFDKLLLIPPEIIEDSPHYSNPTQNVGRVLSYIKTLLDFY